MIGSSNMAIHTTKNHTHNKESSNKTIHTTKNHPTWLYTQQRTRIYKIVR